MTKNTDLSSTSFAIDTEVFSSDHLDHDCDHQRLIEAYFKQLESFGNTLAFENFKNGAWQGITYADLIETSKKISNYYIQLGLQPGDKVAILSNSNNYYPALLLACLYSGVTAVPLDVMLSEAELSNILLHAEPKLILASENHFELASRIVSRETQQIPDFKAVQIEHIEYEIQNKQPLLTPGLRQIKNPAIITYTSGTTGSPKGVMISYKNLLYEIQGLRKRFGTEKKIFLSILPMNHLFELSGGILAPLTTGATIHFANTTNAFLIMKYIKVREINGK